MVPARTRLILIRHGESAWNAQDRMQGQLDPPLSALGREQAGRAAPLVAAWEPTQVISSDLLRARETAAGLGHPDAPTDPAWRELDTGEWSERLIPELPQDEVKAWRRGEVDAPGGETWARFQERVVTAFEALAALGGTWLVVTHGGCIRAATAHVMGAHIGRVAGPRNASLTVIEAAPRPRLVAFNSGT